MVVVDLAVKLEALRLRAKLTIDDIAVHMLDVTRPTYLSWRDGVVIPASMREPTLREAVAKLTSALASGKLPLANATRSPASIKERRELISKL